VFLTGATGFLGAHILAELLGRSAATIHCLVRTEDAEQGRSRLFATLERLALLEEVRAAGAEQRVQAVPGDLGAARLGLSEDRFDAMAAAMDAIIHCGANVDFFKPYAALAAPNVGGTREVLRLACRTRTKPLHHVSTIGVIPFEQLGQVDIVRETDPLPPPDGLGGGYEQTKWVAEKLVQAAAARGLPVTIHRPGRVAPSARTGRGNPDDMASRVFTGCVGMGAVPDLEGTLDITPVDYCAAALVHLALHGPTDGRIYHLVNPVRSRMADAYDVAESRGFPMRRLPYETWHAEFTARVRKDPSDPLYPLLPLLSPHEDGALDEADFLPDARMPELGWEHVREGLAGSGITCPVVDATLIGKWMDVGGG
jgi:thioester reductase-like protein